MDERGGHRHVWLPYTKASLVGLEVVPPILPSPLLLGTFSDFQKIKT